jgi:hypothetical protein
MAHLFPCSSIMDIPLFSQLHPFLLPRRKFLIMHSSIVRVEVSADGLAKRSLYSCHSCGQSRLNVVLIRRWSADVAMGHRRRDGTLAFPARPNVL